MMTIDASDHLVDSIVQFKRTPQGVPQFRLAMCCLCCKGRQFWFTKPKLEECGCSNLKKLAKQAEEMSVQGIDIQSHKTTTE